MLRLALILQALHNNKNPLEPVCVLHSRYSLWQFQSAVHYIKGQILQLHFDLLWVWWPNFLLGLFWQFLTFSDSPAAFRTLPRGMYQAVNPLKDYGYPSDYGLPMASLASNNSCYITSNPLSEMEMEEEMALGGRQQPHPQVTSNSWWENCLVFGFAIRPFIANLPSVT